MSETASPAESQPVLTERRGHVLFITLNRPDAMNAVNLDLANALAGALDTLDADDDLRVGVLTGNGRGFSAGMDLKAFVAGGMPSCRAGASPASPSGRPQAAHRRHRRLRLRRRS